MYILRRHRHPGSIRWNANLPSLRESNCDAASTPQPANRKPTSALHRAHNETPGPTNGPSRPTKFSPPSDVSATGPEPLIQRTLISGDLLERVLVDRIGNESYDGVNVKPSSIQPVTPPIIIFTGRPSRARRNAALLAPLQRGQRSRRQTPCPSHTRPSGRPLSRCGMLIAPFTWPFAKALGPRTSTTIKSGLADSDFRARPSNQSRMRASLRSG